MAAFDSTMTMDDLVREVVSVVRASCAEYDELVQELHAYLFTDWTDDPSVQVTVVLRPEIDVETLRWDRLAPIDRAIVARVYELAPGRIPYVRYLSEEDWQADLRGDDEEMEWGESNPTP